MRQLRVYFVHLRTHIQIQLACKHWEQSNPTMSIEQANQL